MAILALEKEKANPVVAQRLKHAFTYLKERRCPGGGWNVGNPVMFDAALLGRAPETALSLLALLTAFPEPYDQQDIEIIRREMSEDSSAISLGWGTLLLQKIGMDHSESMAKLASTQLDNGSWMNNCYHTALALIAERGYLSSASIGCN